MKRVTIVCFVALVVVAVVSSPAAEDSMLVLTEGGSISGHNSVYAQELPRLSHLRESIENDMQQMEAAQGQAGNPAGESIVIENGFVIFDGRYVPPPYAVHSDRGIVHINELEVPQMRPGQFFRRFVNMRQTNRRFMNRGGGPGRTTSP